MKRTITANRFWETSIRRGPSDAAAMAWRKTSAAVIHPADWWMPRMVLSESPRRSARKAKCGPARRGIMLTSARVPARQPASEKLAALRPSHESTTKMQNRLIAR
jgi:hypothetical protein